MAEGNPIQQLDSQVDEMLQLYDLGEKLHGYEQIHGGRSLNEDQRRRNMVSFSSNRATSANILQGASMWGLAALYIYSRRGAANPMDLSRLRACGWTTLSIFMMGQSIGCVYKMEAEKIRLND